MTNQFPLLICVGHQTMIERTTAKAASAGLCAHTPTTHLELDLLLNEHADRGGCVLLSPTMKSFDMNSADARWQQHVIDFATRAGFIVCIVPPSAEMLMLGEIPYLSDAKRRRAVRLIALFVLISTGSTEFRNAMNTLFPRARGNIRAEQKFDDEESLILMRHVRQVIHTSQNV